MRKYNPDRVHWSRCGHPWCTACKTRRGRNRGNRNNRHAVRAVLRRLTGLSALLVITGASVASCEVPMQRASAAVSCPAGKPAVCVQTPPGGIGQEDVAAAGQDPGTPWLVTDPGGAPMAWVNLYGLYSGGDGGKDPGGLVCVTNGVWETVACMTPTGTLVLARPTATGVVQATEVLTPGDIAFIHRLHKLEREGKLP